MPERIRLNRLEQRFEELSYPVHRDDAIDEYAETTVEFADGDANLGELIEEIGVDRFEDPSELFVEIHNVVPIGAVGEPGQSEGDS